MSSMNNSNSDSRQRQQELALELALNVIELVTRNGQNEANRDINGVLIQLVQTVLQQLVINPPSSRGTMQPTNAQARQTSDLSNQFRQFRPNVGENQMAEMASVSSQMNNSGNSSGSVNTLGPSMAKHLFSNTSSADSNSNLLSSLSALLPPNGGNLRFSNNASNGTNTQHQQQPPPPMNQSQNVALSDLLSLINGNGTGESSSAFLACPPVGPNWNQQQQQQQQAPQLNSVNNLLLQTFLSGGLPPQPPHQQQQLPNNDNVAPLLRLLQQSQKPEGQNASLPQQQQPLFNSLSATSNNQKRGGGGGCGSHGRHSSAYPMRNIEVPGSHDVLLGRGRGTSNHTGNVAFRSFIKKHKAKYVAASRIDKPKVAGEVVAKWRALDPPGRFLVQNGDGTTNNDGNQLWNDVGDRRARQKTSQSLRERECVRSYSGTSRGGNRTGLPAVSGSSSSVGSGDCFDDDGRNNEMKQTQAGHATNCEATRVSAESSSIQSLSVPK